MQVLAAIGWVVQHRDHDGLNIRVLNLSFGTDGAQDYRLDPMTYAVEVAWRHGIVVVTAAGNSQGAGSLDIWTASRAPAPEVTPTWDPASGTGSLHLARGSAIVADEDGVELVGEQDIFGTPWDGKTWSELAWEGKTWSGGDWLGKTWSWDSWTGKTWSTASWG